MYRCFEVGGVKDQITVSATAYVFLFSWKMLSANDFRSFPSIGEIDMLGGLYSDAEAGAFVEFLWIGSCEILRGVSHEIFYVFDAEV